MALTRKDLAQIKQLIDESRDQTIDAILMYWHKNHPTKQELDQGLSEIRSEFKHLPNKDEFYVKTDETRNGATGLLCYPRSLSVILEEAVPLDGTRLHRGSVKKDWIPAFLLRIMLRKDKIAGMTVGNPCRMLEQSTLVSS